MPSSKKKYIAAGLIAAGSAAAVTAYAVHRRREKQVDKELAGMLDEAEVPRAKPALKAETPALSGARADHKDAGAAIKDVMAAKPAVENRPNPAS
jgi:hypothetical protein